MKKKLKNCYWLGWHSCHYPNLPKEQVCRFTIEEQQNCEHFKEEEDSKEYYEALDNCT